MNRTNQLRRLCALRRLEEQNEAALLGQAKQHLERTEEALQETKLRQRTGRALIQASFKTGDTEDRLAGLEEIANAKRKASALSAAKLSAEDAVQRAHRQFFSKRVERCQAESLLDAALQEDAAIAQRRSQSALDEWHRTAHRRPALIPAEDEQSSDSTIA
jgi:hypothetical protein